jgi:release factor glutamine methyltransferase
LNRRKALIRACDIFQENNIEQSSLEGEILFRHVLGIDRAHFFTDLDLPITDAQVEELMQLVERRRLGEPSAYITGHREFFGLDFTVNTNVLIPRPETELLVEKAIGMAKERRILKIADIGTGCGAIAVSLAVNLKDAAIYAVDISAGALEVAAENCRKHKVMDRITLLSGDMLMPLPGPVDMITANLPYVRQSDLPPGGPLKYEPQLALDGGEEGLDKIKELCFQSREKLNKNGIILMEIGEGQGETVKDIITAVFPEALIEIDNDLAGIERLVTVRLT